MPLYFLLKDKIILRLEEEEQNQEIFTKIRPHLLDESAQALDQDQANYRVAIFRDEIKELGEINL